MAGKLKLLIQSLFNKCGLQVRRLNTGVQLEDPYAEQARLATGDVRVIFEVGAADGRDSEGYCQRFPQAQVFAFEPVPESYQQIETRTKRLPSLRAYNVALSNEPGSAQFHLSEWLDASSLLAPKSTGSTADQYTASKKSILVEVDTLDAICQRLNIDRIDILKMDAQGAELNILLGAQRMLAEGRIGVIFTEVLFVEFYQGAARFDQIALHLIERGFKLHNLYSLAHNQKGEITQADAIFVLNRSAN